MDRPYGKYKVKKMTTMLPSRQQKNLFNFGLSFLNDKSYKWMDGWVQFTEFQNNLY